MGLEPAEVPAEGPFPSSCHWSFLQAGHTPGGIPGAWDSCCFQQGSGWAKVTCRHTHHTHTRAGMVCLSQGLLLPRDLVPTGHLCLPGSPGRWQGSGEGRGSRTGAWLGAQCPDRGLAFALGEMGLLCPRALTAVQQRPFTAFGPDFWDRAGHGLPGGWCGPRLVPGCSGCLYWCEAGVGTEAAPGRHQAFGSTVLAGGDETPVQPGGFPQGKGGPAFLATEGPSKDPGPPACGQDRQRPAETQLVKLPVHLSFPAARSSVMERVERLEKCGRGGGCRWQPGVRMRGRTDSVGWAGLQRFDGCRH